MAQRSLRRFLALFLISALSVLPSCGKLKESGLFSQEDAPAVETDPVPSDTLPAVAAHLRNTHYYTIFQSDFPAGTEKEVIDTQGNVLARVGSKFYSALALEGSGVLSSGRVLNYVTAIGGVSRFTFTKNNWGNGVGNCSLEPFRTIAVDRKVIPMGSIVYIDETRGIVLPDGSIHNGIWRAEDTGSAIQGDRVDLYVGKKAWNTRLTQNGIGHLQALSVRILQLPNAQSCAR